VPADAAEARRLAEEILSQPEYQPPTEPWYQQALEWVSERLARLFGSIGGSGGSPVVGWVVVAIVVALVGLLVWRLVRDRRGRGRRQGPEATEVVEARVDWRAEAARLEAAGDWKGGLRARYRALVAALAARQALDPGVGRTTGDHRSEVAERAPDGAEPFDAAAELFDRAWYGGRPTGPTEAERFDELARAVDEAAR
jgi:hypothetical protein